MQWIFRVALTVGIIGFTLSTSQAFEPQQIVAGKFFCKDAASSEMLARAAKVSPDRAKAAMAYQYEAGNCGVLPQPVPVKLITKLSEFVDYEGDTIEIWRIHNSFFVFIVDTSKKAPPA